MSMPPSLPPLEYATPVARAPRSFARRFGWILFVGLAIMFLLLMRQGRASSGSVPTVSLGQFTLAVNAGALFSADVGDSDVEFVVNSSGMSTSRLPTSVGGRYRVDLPTGAGNDWKFLQWLTDPHNNSYASVTLNRGRQNLLENLLLPLIPWILIFGFIWFFVYRQIKSPRQPLPVVIVNPEARP